MHFDWQTIIALACVAAALAFLARRALGLFGRQGGCGTGGCGSCPSKSVESERGTARPFVPLDLLEQPRR
ncbi:MAG: hypothetical protein WD066_06005 [Planctomycetaceae bacterium]